MGCTLPEMYRSFLAWTHTGRCCKSWSYAGPRLFDGARQSQRGGFVAELNLLRNLFVQLIFIRMNFCAASCVLGGPVELSLFGFNGKMSLKR